MIAAIMRLFSLRRPVTKAAPVPKLIMPASCIDAVRAGLAVDLARGHEGIVYLLGRTDGSVTLAIAVFKPVAETTPGSFNVSATALVPCLLAASRLELQVVGQLHTHPRGAGHSKGDMEGARMRYAGYVSVVLPDYGRRLPSLDGCTAYTWTATGEWEKLKPTDIIVVPGAGPWTAKPG